MTKKVEHSAQELEEYCYDTIDICCSKCHISNSISGVNDCCAAEEFFKLGWRATLYNCYCPKCAKRYIREKLKIIKRKLKL
jgi:hypothetical protein